MSTEIEQLKIQLDFEKKKFGKMKDRYTKERNEK